jgi:hypothetical protein
MPRIRGVPILVFPAVAGSIPSPAPWIVAQTISVTLATGSATGTVAAGANANLNIGQPVTGTGIPPNTYVLLPAPTTTTITLSNPATATGAQSLTFGQFDPVQSPSGLVGPGAWAGYPVPPLLNQAGAFNDVNGCLFETPDIFVIPIGGTLVIPPGEGMLNVVSGTTAPQYQLFQGTSAPAWVTIGTIAISTTTLLPFMSDGANARINSPTVATTVTIYQWR